MGIKRSVVGEIIINEDGDVYYEEFPSDLAVWIVAANQYIDGNGAVDLHIRNFLIYSWMQKNKKFPPVYKIELDGTSRRVHVTTKNRRKDPAI